MSMIDGCFDCAVCGCGDGGCCCYYYRLVVCRALDALGAVGRMAMLGYGACEDMRVDDLDTVDDVAVDKERRATQMEEYL